ncbi:MAG: 50S ribosomal protein L9 [Phycisphaerae bacterium]|nr:50S ribosomal protein L9 [Phycisphaerae bacterium]
MRNTKNIELLLLETIESLGIVGDIVKVKPGYARNYLLPHGYAEFPTQEKIDSLKEARQAAELQLQELHSQRNDLIDRMQDVTLSLQRACNDQGALYGSITQRDISDALIENGFGVDARAVRLHQPFRRVGEYTVPIQFSKEQRVEINVSVIPDRSLEDEREEMEFDNEGELIIKQPKAEKSEQADSADDADQAESTEDPSETAASEA